MPPKGTKKGAARKRGADLKKPAAPKKQKMAQMGIKKNPAPTHDVNGFLTGSKEANWAFLRASGAWYTDLEEVDLVEAEDKGVKLGSNDWVTMKTSQLAPPVLEGTRILSRVEWEFPVPRLGVSELRSSALGRGSKRRADDDDDDDDDGAPLSKRARRGAGAGATVTVETRDDGDGKAHVDLLTPLALPTSQQGRSMAFGMGLPVLDTLPPSQRNQATTTITTTTTTTPPPPPAHHPSPIPRNDHIITTPPSSSTLSSLASQTPSPPPSTTPPLTPSPALPPATKTTTPGRKGAPRGSFPCPRCDKSFGRVEHLKRHIVSVHEKRRAFVCEGCGARFSRKDNMRQHQGKCGGMMGGVEG